jgi:hypothetical protein
VLTKYILLILFFGAVYLCSSIIPALAPSEVKSTHKQILLLLKITATSTVFLLASNYSNSDYIIAGVIAALVLVILFLAKENPAIYYFLPALVGLSILSENYYILTCMTTTLFLKGMIDYSDVKKIEWSDKRIATAIYLIITTAVVIVIANTVNASSL